MVISRGGSSKRPRTARDEDAPVSHSSVRIYVNERAELSATFIRKRAIVSERGLHIERFV